MAFSKETTILCVGCTEKEIRIIKQNLPNKNIQIAETEIAFELYVIPNFLTIINPDNLDKEEIDQCAAFYKETDYERPVLTHRCEKMDSKRIRYRLVEGDEFAEKIKFIILEYKKSLKKDTQFYNSLTEVLLVLKEIRDNPGISTKKIAEKIERNERKVLRYIHTLACAGEWIEYDSKKRGWYLLDGHSIFLQGFPIYEEEQGMEKFKDNRELNRRSVKDQLANMELLADCIRAEEENGNERYNFLLKGYSQETKEHKPDHTVCSAIKEDNSPNKITEKRICRCMNYYSKESAQCKNCKLERKFQNAGKNYFVAEYEVPTRYVIEGVGGIDLVIKDARSGVEYAVEIKSPKKNSETLTRMIAEILTYTAGMLDKYKPAICFFEGSTQYKDFCNDAIRSDENFQYLLTQVDVFYITYTEKDGIVDYVIHSHKEEPLW